MTPPVEAVAARTTGAILMEDAIRAHTTPPLVLTAVVAVVAAVLAVRAGGAGILLGVVAACVLLLAALAFVVRAGVVAALRRFAGGPGYVAAAPIVRRHLTRLKERNELPMSRLGVVRLLLLVRRREELKRRVVATGEAITGQWPELLDELRTALPA